MISVNCPICKNIVESDDSVNLKNTTANSTIVYCEYCWSVVEVEYEITSVEAYNSADLETSIKHIHDTWTDAIKTTTFSSNAEKLLTFIFFVRTLRENDEMSAYIADKVRTP